MPKSVRPVRPYVQRRLAPVELWAAAFLLMIGVHGACRGPALRRSSARSVLCHRPRLLPPGRDPRLVPLAGLAGRELHARPDRCTSRSAPARVYPAPNRRQMTSVIPNTKVQ